MTDSFYREFPTLRRGEINRLKREVFSVHRRPACHRFEKAADALFGGLIEPFRQADGC